MKIDFKSGFVLFIIIALGVYVANMWGYKMIEADQKQKEYDEWVKAQNALPPPSTTV